MNIIKKILQTLLLGHWVHVVEDDTTLFPMRGVILVKSKGRSGKLELEQCIIALALIAPWRELALHDYGLRVGAYRHSYWVTFTYYPQTSWSRQHPKVALRKRLHFARGKTELIDGSKSYRVVRELVVK